MQYCLKSVSQGWDGMCWNSFWIHINSQAQTICFVSRTLLFCLFILTGRRAVLDLQQRLRLCWLWHKESRIPLALDVWRSTARPGPAQRAGGFFSSRSCALMGSGFLWCFLSEWAFRAAAVALWEECERYQMRCRRAPRAHKCLHTVSFMVCYCLDMWTVNVWK